jgi:hypothetical protein
VEVEYDKARFGVDNPAIGKGFIEIANPDQLNGKGTDSFRIQTEKEIA